jgi:hypothetical protein
MVKSINYGISYPNLLIFIKPKIEFLHYFCLHHRSIFIHLTVVLKSGKWQTYFQEFSPFQSWYFHRCRIIISTTPLDVLPSALIHGTNAKKGGGELKRKEPNEYVIYSGNYVPVDVSEPNSRNVV